MATLALGRIGIVGFPWPGDLYTGTGQRQSFRLEDGSQLVLDARSQVRPEFDGYRRRLRLREGRLLVDVARDPARPFVVDTGRGQVEAQGTRFQVSDDGASSRVVVLESRVRITTADGRQCLLERGQSARFDASAILARGPAEGGESAWLDGRLEVRDRPLGEVLEALRAYRRGIISVADDAAALRVSGIYPLDDSGAALALLEQSLPIRLDYHGPYWVSIASR